MASLSKGQIALQVSCLGLTGLGIGWLMRQSISPLLVTLITGLLAVIGAVVSGLAGVKADASSSTPSPLQREVTAVPLAAFVMGLAVGAPVGIHARTHHWFGLSPEQEISTWVALGLEKKEVTRRIFEGRFPATAPERRQLWLGGDPAKIIEPWVALDLEKKAVAQRLFDQFFPAGAETSITTSSVVPREQSQLDILFESLPEEECARYEGLRGAELKEKMLGGVEDVRELVKTVPEDKLADVMRIKCKF